MNDEQTCVVCGKGFPEGQFRCCRELTVHDADKMHPNCVWKVVEELTASQAKIEWHQLREAYRDDRIAFLRKENERLQDVVYGQNQGIKETKRKAVSDGCEMTEKRILAGEPAWPPFAEYIYSDAIMEHILVTNMEQARDHLPPGEVEALTWLAKRFSADPEFQCWLLPKSPLMVPKGNTMNTDATTKAAMQLMERIEVLEAELAHTEAVLVDCQKAHDVTIAERDELRATLTAVRKLIDEEEWNSDFRQVLVDALGEP